MEEVIIDTDYAKVIFDFDLSMAMVTWKGKADNDQYKNVFESIFQFADRKNTMADNFISDIRDAVVVGPENRKWFESVAIPEAKRRGLKRAGVIFDGNVFKKYYLNMIIKTTNKFNLPVKLFNEPEEAIEWFKTF